MKVETKLFLYLVPFFSLMTVIYGFWSDFKEPVGLVGLPVTGLMCAMIGWYLAMTASKLDARPSDDPEGEIADQAGDYGHFAPYSWAPLWLALAAALTFLSLAVGWWLTVVAVPFLILAVINWSFEYFRGPNHV